MKLISFETPDGRRSIGALLPDLETASDLTASGESCFTDMLSLIGAGETGLDRARHLLASPMATIAVSQVRLLAPVPEPTQLFDCLCFEEHLLNSARHAHLIVGGDPIVDVSGGVPEIYRELPVYYKGNRLSVVGAEAEIVRPRYTRFLDYELEFGVFVGRTGRNWTEAEAAEAIFGYCIYNDVSARDIQVREMRGMLGPSKGKDFDTGNVMGPWLVTKDEIPDPQGLAMRAWINGELVTDGSSAGMLHSFPKILAYASQDETRRAGEFFGSGTVGGGCSLEHGRFLADGDLLELEVEGLGRQRNRIRFQPDAG